MARILVLLLPLCLAGASAAPAPAPAPAPATGLQPEEVCVGIGTNSTTLACLGNVAVTCLAASAVTAETAYMGCFVTGVASQCQLLGKAPRAKEKGCIGFDISDEQMRCLGLAFWDCIFDQGSIFDKCYIPLLLIKCLN